MNAADDKATQVIAHAFARRYHLIKREVCISAWRFGDLVRRFTPGDTPSASLPSVDDSAVADS